MLDSPLVSTLDGRQEARHATVGSKERGVPLRSQYGSVLRWWFTVGDEKEPKARERESKLANGKEMKNYDSIKGSGLDYRVGRRSVAGGTKSWCP